MKKRAKTQTKAKKPCLSDVSIGSFLSRDKFESELEIENYLAVDGSKEELDWYYKSVADDFRIEVDEYVENHFGHIADAISRHLGTNDLEAIRKESWRLASLFADAWQFERYGY